MLGETELTQLPPEEHGRLADRLMRSLEPEPQDAPENIAKAWDMEMARRIEEMDARRTKSISYEQVRAELRALISSHCQG